MSYPKALSDLIEEFSKFPGIGSKTAERMALHMLSTDKEEAFAMAKAIEGVKTQITPCPVCGNLAQTGQQCDICNDTSRQSSLLCVVESPKDIIAVERSGRFKGRYHVLGGKLSPLKSIGPEQLRIEQLKKRIPEQKIEEVILATGADIEGETTAVFIAGELRPLGVKTTRIAYGIPVGNSLDYTDEMTLMRAIEGRTNLSDEMELDSDNLGILADDAPF